MTHASEERSGEAGGASLLCRETLGQPFRSVSIVGDRLRIGRRFENDLILSHASVSRFHAEITRERGEWFVVDCGSKYGTSLNGERVGRARLAPGDEIRIGGDDGPLLVFSPVKKSRGASADSGAGDSARRTPSDDSLSGAGAPTGAALWLVERFRATSLIGDFREALALVADAALELTRFDRAALFVTNRGETGDDLPRAEVVRTRAGGAPVLSGAREAPFVRAAVAAGRTVSVSLDVEPAEEDREPYELARSAGIHRAVCVPLRALSVATLSATGEAKRVPVGALYLEGGHGTAPVADSVRSVLELLAGEAGIVVERLYERQFNIARIRARQAAQAAQLASRARDEALPLADRARAASELAGHMLATGDTAGASAALERYADPAVRAQLPDAVRAEVLDAFGVAFMWETRYHRAAGVLNAALGALGDGENPTLEMGIRARLALCYAEIGELGIAREHALTAVTYLRRANESSAEYARALLALGVLEQHDNDLTAAAHTFRSAARVAEHVDDLLVRAVANFRLGLVHAERGDVEEAVASLQRMLELARPLGNVRMLAVGQRALAECLVRSGAWRRAEAVIGAGLETAARAGLDHERARLLLLVATLAVRRDGGDAAERAVGAAREAAAAVGDRRLAAEADLLEAELRIGAGEMAAARDALAAASRTARETDDARLQARVHLGVAEAERRERAYDSAEAHVAKAQHIANESRDLVLAGAAQHTLGRLNADRGRFTEAQHNLAQSLSVFRTVDDRPRIAEVHLDLGHLMLAAGDPSCARTHLQLAREIFADLGRAAGLASAEAGLHSAIAAAPEGPASYSSVVLGATSEPRFVRRLLEAAQSRGLLLRELTSIALDLARSTWAAVLVCTAEGDVRVVTASGEEAGRDVPLLAVVRAGRGETLRNGELTLYPVEPLAVSSGGREATVLALDVTVPPASRTDTALQSAVQLARQGLELVALRASLKRADLPDPTAPLAGADQPHDTGAVAAGLIFASPAMRQIVERLQRIRASSTTVLITGESGVGKEVIARAIHAASARPLAPFVPFNCSAAVRELVESQLFGHKKGAFTGATADHPGVARAARNGTLFLDEVGDLPFEVQPKLLRFLESGEIQPLGETTPQRVEVRVIAATNADLEQAVEERRFREDLYHRLNIIRLHVPPLRERPEEIPLLVSHFLARFTERAGFERPPAISEEVLDAMLAYPWPGNVRELRNEVERLVTFAAEGATITKEVLTGELRAYAEAPAPAAAGGVAFDDPSLALADRLRLFEIEQIRLAMAAVDFNLTRAAASLGMARQNLQRRLKKLGLKSPEA